MPIFNHGLPVQVVVPDEGAATGGTAELNIAYGDTAPEDTSKLWIKAAEPNHVELVRELPTVAGTVELLDATLGENIYCPAAATVGGKIYLFGGYDPEAAASVNTIRVYDPENQILTTLEATLPAAKVQIAAAAIGTKIYLFGGRTDLTNTNRDGACYVFDTATNTIETLPVQLSAFGSKAVAIGDKIYLVAGGGGYSNGTVVWDKIWIYDTQLQTWQSTEVTYKYSYDHCIAAIGAKIYIFDSHHFTSGGLGYGYAYGIAIYDTETDTMSYGTSRREYTGGRRAIPVDKKIYLIGGYSDTSNNNEILVYDTETDSYSSLNIKIKYAYNAVVEKIGTKIYQIGGRAQAANTYNNEIYKLSLESTLATNQCIIELTTDKNQFNLINGENCRVEVGVKDAYIGNAENIAERVPIALFVNGAWAEV